jgi:hypothetical protein
MEDSNETPTTSASSATTATLDSLQTSLKELLPSKTVVELMTAIASAREMQDNIDLWALIEKCADDKAVVKKVKELVQKLFEK